MPTDINKALASAKNALASAKSFTASTGDSDPSRFAPKPAAAAAPAPKSKPSAGLASEAGSAGEGIKARMENVKQVEGSFKKGGKVPKTGAYKLHAGEHVIPAASDLNKSILERATSALGGDKVTKAKQKLHMNIKPTDDNRFHVTHSYSGSEPRESTEHAPSNLQELLEHVKAHYSPEKETDSAPEEQAEGESANQE